MAGQAREVTLRPEGGWTSWKGERRGEICVLGRPCRCSWSRGQGGRGARFSLQSPVRGGGLHHRAASPGPWEAVLGPPSRRPRWGVGRRHHPPRSGTRAVTRAQGLLGAGEQGAAVETAAPQPPSALRGARDARVLRLSFSCPDPCGLLGWPPAPHAHVCPPRRVRRAAPGRRDGAGPGAHVRDAAHVHRHRAEPRAAQRGRRGRRAQEAVQRGGRVPGEGGGGLGGRTARGCQADRSHAGSLGAGTRDVWPAREGSFPPLTGPALRSHLSDCPLQGGVRPTRTRLHSPGAPGRPPATR